jgi:cell division protein FtsL
MTLYTRSKNFEKKFTSRGNVVLNVLIVITLIGLSFCYVFQANNVIGTGYEIRDYQQKIKELQSQKQKLQIEAAQMQFPQNLAEIAKNLNMEEVNQVIYLNKSLDVAVNSDKSNN